MLVNTFYKCSLLLTSYYKKCPRLGRVIKKMALDENEHEAKPRPDVTNIIRSTVRSFFCDIQTGRISYEHAAVCIVIRVTESCLA